MQTAGHTDQPREQMQVQTLEDFQTNCHLLECALNQDFEDPGPDLMKLQSWMDWFRTGNGTVEFKDYFFKQALPKIALGLLRRRYSSEQHLEPVKVFLCVMIGFVLKAVQQMPNDSLRDLFALLPELFSPFNPMYMTWGIEADLQAKAEYADMPDLIDGELWKDVVEVGGFLDVKNTLGKWERVKVLDMSPTKTEVQVLFDSGVDQWFSLDSPDVAQSGQFTSAQTAVVAPEVTALPDSDAAPSSIAPINIEEVQDRQFLTFDGLYIADPEWAEMLDVGSAIDAKNSNTRWYQAVVLAKRTRMVESAEPMDIETTEAPSELLPDWVEQKEVLVAFLGFGERFDEWLALDSGRMAPLDRVSNGQRGQGAMRMELHHVLKVQDENDPDDDNLYAVSHPLSFVSSHLVQLINDFGNQDGFNVLLQKIQEEGTCPLNLLVPIIATLGRMAPHLTRSFAQKYIPELKKAVVKNTLSIQQQELRNILKDTLNIIYLNLLLLLKRVFPREEAGHCAEGLLLQLVSTFLKSPFLNRRLDGLRILTDCVGMVINASEYPSGIKISYTTVNGVDTPNYKALPISHWLTRESLAKWIVSNKFLEGIFRGEGAHESLIQRSPELLKFLARENHLTDDSLELVWSSPVYDKDKMSVFLNISDVLSEPHVQFLLDKVSLTSPMSYSLEMLDLVKALAHRVYLGLTPRNLKDEDLAVDPPLFSRCVQMLWDIMTNTGQVSSEVQDAACNKLEELVQMGGWSKKADSDLWLTTKDWARHFYKSSRIVERCIEALTSHRTVIWCLRLMRYVLQSYPKDEMGDREEVEALGLPIASISRAAVAIWMQKTHQVVDLLVSDVLHIKEEATAYAHTLVSALGPNQLGTLVDIKPVGDSDMGYLKQLEKRLDFLIMMLRASPLQLDQGKVDQLWTKLVLQATTETEKDKALEWFNRAAVRNFDASQPNLMIFSFEILNWLLHEKMSDPDFIRGEQFSTAAFSCLERYYRFKASREGAIVEHVGMSRFFTVMKVEPLQLDMFWTVALTAQDEKVQENALLFLTRLPSRLSAELTNQGYVLEMRRALLDKCILYLQNPGEECRRCLKLLHTLLDETAAEGRGKLRMHSSGARGAAIKMKVNNSTKNSPKAKQFEITVYQNDMGDDLVGMVAHMLARRPNEIRVFCSAKEIKDTLRKKTLKDLGYRSGMALMVSDNPTARQKKENSEGKDEAPEDVIESSVESLPAAILASKNESFEILFNLVDSAGAGSATGRSAWELLMRLPTSVKLQQALLFLGEENSSNPLHDLIRGNVQPPSLPKLLYTLQILDYFIQPADTLDDFQELLENKPELVGWAQRFLENEGFALLYEVLLSPGMFSEDKNEGTSTLPKLVTSCLALLLKIVDLLLTKAANASELSALEALDKFYADVAKDENRDPQWMEEVYGKEEDSNKALAWGHLLSFSKKEGNTILSATNLAQVQNRMLALLEWLGSSSTGDVDPAKVICIDQVTRIWLLSLTLTPSLLADFYALEGGKILYHLTMLCRGRSAGMVREKFSKVVQYICTMIPGDIELPCVYITNYLKSQIPRHRAFGDQPSKEEGRALQDYFDLLSILLRDHGPQVLSSSEELHAMAWDLVTEIVLSPPEVSSCITFDDKVLHGFMDMLCTLIILDGELGSYLGYRFEEMAPDSVKELNLIPPALGLPGYLLHVGLFNQPDPNSSPVGGEPPQCKTSRVRGAAYTLLITLCRASRENAMAVLRTVHEFHKRGILTQGWSNDPLQDRCSDAGYVGIRNLGCICYMNSLLQQLFMIPALRQGVFKTPLEQFDDLEAESADRKDNILHHLQAMFAFLSLSRRQAFNPLPWCLAYKDETGVNPTNVMMQQDAYEFLQMFCDRLEQKLKGTPQENLLMNVFGGKLCNQIFKATDSGEVRESDEPYSCISLKVQDMGDLERSLVNFCEGERISDYEWEEGNKVDIIRRTCLKQLENTVVLHLKRFEFNFDTFVREKLNDRFAFPNELDFFPYTKEGLEWQESGGKATGEDKYTVHPRSYYEYELVGVVVHLGTADSGHYYSLIKKRSNDQHGSQAGEQSWFEFNDASVRPFNPSKLNEECFGGSQSVSDYDLSTQKWMPRNLPTIKNAYMLVYERKQPLPISDSEEGNANMTCSDCELVPSNIRENIWSENLMHLHRQKIYSRDHLAFCVDLIHAVKFDPILTLEGPTAHPTSEARQFADMAMFFALQIFPRAHHLQRFPDLCSILEESVVEVNYPATKHYLLEATKEFSHTKELMLSCPEIKVRSAVTKLFLKMLTVLQKAEPEALLSPTVAVPLVISIPGESSQPSEEQDPQMDIALETLIDDEVPVSCFLHSCLSDLTMQDVAVNWRKSTSFFWMLAEWAKQSWENRYFLVQRDALQQLCDLFLGEASPLSGTVYKKGSRKRPPSSANPALPSAQNSRSKNSNNSQSQIPDWTDLLKLISLLTRTCKNQGMIDRPEMEPPNTLLPCEGVPPPELSEPSRQCVLERNLYVFGLKQAKYCESLGQMMAHISWEWKDFTTDGTAVILQGLATTTTDGACQYFKVLDMLLSVEDSLSQERVEVIFSGEHNLLELLYRKQETSPRFVCISLRSVMELIRRHQKVKDYLRSPQVLDGWAGWSCTFLHQYCKSTKANAESASNTNTFANAKILIFGEQDDQDEELPLHIRAQNYFEMLCQVLKEMDSDPSIYLETDTPVATAMDSTAGEVDPTNSNSKEGQKMSDEEYARQMQQYYDNEMMD